jgi:predicted RNase H-like nuclease (RuvC/YqgF family)
MNAEIIDLRKENDDLLRQISGMHNDITTLKAHLNEACEELARWKVECLERRKFMVKEQHSTLLNVPINGVCK